MPIGRVKSYDTMRGFGFIQPDSTVANEDHFVHVSSVLRAGLERLSVGQRIRYDAVPNRKRPGTMAHNLELIEE